MISFKNNYMKRFSQTDWFPAEEFMGMPELMVDRGDFEQFSRLLSKMLTEHEFRATLSGLCRERIIHTSGNPEGMARDCERVFLILCKNISLWPRVYEPAEKRFT